MIGGRTCLWYRVIAALLRKPPIEPASVCTRLSAVLLSSMRILVAAQQVPSPPGACLPACALLPQVGRGRAAGVPAPCLRVVALASSRCPCEAPWRHGSQCEPSFVASPRVAAARFWSAQLRAAGRALRRGLRRVAPPSEAQAGQARGLIGGGFRVCNFLPTDGSESEKTGGKSLSHTASQNKSNTVLL